MQSPVSRSLWLEGREIVRGSQPTVFRCVTCQQCCIQAGSLLVVSESECEEVNESHWYEYIKRGAREGSP